MGDRGIRLLKSADAQISGLIGAISEQGDAALSRPCPGREKLGDGTVAALARHTADRYLWIAEFLQATSHTLGSRARQGGPGIPRFLGVRGHGPSGHADSAHDQGTREGGYTAATIDLDGLLQRLSAGRNALSALAELTDEALDAVPPAGSFRFCDGQRNLELVITGLLKHQGHQVDAINATLAGAT